MGTKKTTQQDSSTQAESEQRQKLNLDPGREAAITQGFGQATDLISSRLNQPLELQQFTGFSPTLNPLVKSTLNQQVSDLKGSRDRASSGLIESLTRRGASPVAIQAIKNQNQQKSAGDINQATSGALKSQLGLDQALASILGNQNRTNLAARGQLFQELTPGLSLLDLFRNFAAQTGEQQVSKTGSETSETNQTTRGKKGLLGLF